MTERAGALEGLVVLDLSSNVASAYASQLFADFGAEVIQVERPGGSPVRKMAAWPFWMRGKKSIVLDLRDDADLEVARTLAADSDVVIEAFGAGRADRLGLGYEALRALNPRLVYTSITAFGHSGPYSHLKGYEAVVMAKTGSTYGSIARDRPGEPVITAPLQGTMAAALLAIEGTLAALHERETSGAGQRVDATLIQGMIAQDTWDYLQAEIMRRYPEAYTPVQRPSPGRSTPFGALSFGLLNGYTKDGRWMQFTHPTPRHFEAFIRALGLEHTQSDPELVEAWDNPDIAIRDRWWTLMLEAVRKRTVAEWQEVFARDRNVFAELYRDGLEVLDHPQLLHDGCVIEVQDPRLGAVREFGLLVRMSQTPGAPDRPAPDAGQHDAERRNRRPRGGASAAAAPAPEGAPPLQGLVVVELGTFFAGPMGSATLADQGATVIKIEPLQGDPMRFLIAIPEVAGIRPNQGKLSVAVDAFTDEGREIVAGLIGRADMVLHTFREGVARRMGLDADAMRALNPRLIYHHGVGYGIDGPYAAQPAVAPTISAASGFSRRSGGGGPEGVDLTIDQIKSASVSMTGVQPGHPDGMAPIAVAIGMLLGLYARDRGAGGQTTQTSMLNTMGHVLADTLIDYDGVPPRPQPDAQHLGFSALYRVYRASDAWIVLCAPDERSWARLVAALPAGCGLGQDPRFASAPARAEHDAALAAALAGLVATRRASEWERDLSVADVGCAEIAPHQGRLSESLFNAGGVGEQLGMMTTVTHPIFDDHIRSTELVRLSRCSATLGAAPLIGQHTDQVLRDCLGYDEARIARLRATNVVG